MPRFYHPRTFAVGQHIDLPEPIVRHIQVLRLKTGTTLTLFDGNGCQYHAELTEQGKRHAQCRITSIEHISLESPLSITLIQAVSSGERMDFTLQKSVELGITAIHPVISERCTVRLSGERADKRIQRWQDIVIAACEQSGRNTVPTVHPIINFNQYIKELPKDNSLNLLMGLHRTRRLKDFRQPESIRLLIGPEGGWTTQEEQAAEQAGFHSVTLGKRILRTETASLAAIAAMQTLWGDF